MTEAQLRFLAAKGLISLIPAGDNEFYAAIEPAGLAYFSNKEDNPEGKMLEQLKKIADAAQEQAATAKEQARLAREDAGAAREDARIARRQSRINIGIAIFAVIVALLAWLVPREAVYQAIYAFFQSH